MKDFKIKRILTVTKSKIIKYDADTLELLSEKETEKSITNSYIEAKDGTLHDNLEDCRKHNLVIDKKAVVCPKCKGIGYRISDTLEGRDHKQNCYPCRGSGIIGIQY